MSHISSLLISKSDKFNDIFHSKLIFSKLTDEHVVRLIMLQKIKLAKKLLKYEGGTFNIEVLNIENGFNKEEIIEYSKKFK